MVQYFSQRANDQFYQQKLPAYLAKLDPLRAPKIPANSYALFVSETAQQHPELKFAELAKFSSSKWKGMGETEKKTWVVKSENLQQLYQKNLESFIKKLPPAPAV